MRTQIVISGQISGNYALRSALLTFDCECEKYFNGFMLTYSTEKEAQKMLKQAYNYLCNEEPDFAEDGISLYNDNLSYDASYAKIVE